MALAEAFNQYSTGVWFRLTQGGVMQTIQPATLAELLRKTRLSEQILAWLWQNVNPGSVPVDKETFSWTLRLVSCLQNEIDPQSLPPNEAVPLPRIEGFRSEDILPSSLLTQISIQGAASQVGVNVAARPMLSGQATASRTSLTSETAGEDVDFRLSPSEKFEAESTFAKYSKGSRFVRVGGLEEVFMKSGIQRADWVKICDLIDREKSGYIDQTQLSYLLHMVQQRRKGRRLPNMLPPDVAAAIVAGVTLSGPSLSAQPWQPSMPASRATSNTSVADSVVDRKEPVATIPVTRPISPRIEVSKPTAPTPDTSEADYRSLLRYANAEKELLTLHNRALERELKGVQGQVDYFRGELLPSADRALKTLESLGIAS